MISTSSREDRMDKSAAFLFLDHVITGFATGAAPKNPILLVLVSICLIPPP
jgi:hypothetical protein